MYVATQMPMESTASDFWRLVKDNQCVAIVMLNSLDSTDSSEVSVLVSLRIGSVIIISRLQKLSVSCANSYSRKLHQSKLPGFNSEHE